MNKDKVRELIQETHTGLEGEVLEYLTEKISTKATTEEEATEQVQALTIASIAQSYADARVNQAQKKWKREQKPEEPRKPREEQEEQESPEDPTLSELRALREELNALKAGQLKETRTQTLNALIDTLPEAVRAPFKHIDAISLSEEGFAELIEEVKADVTRIQAELPKGSFTPPRKPGVNATDTGAEKVTDAELEELVKLTGN